MSSVKLMVTNGGPHPADKWASLIASQVAGLIVIDDNSTSDAAVAARKAKPRLSIAISESIEPIVADACKAERQAVESGVITVRHAPFSVDIAVDQGMSAVSAEVENTPFKDAFETPEVLQAIRRVIHQNIIDAANIERSWALDAKGL